MPKVQYGSKTIEYTFLKKESLKAHYISVDREKGVTLKGATLSLAQANQLILKKAKWIVEKLALVESIPVDDLVTGSRIQYLGKKYYVQVFQKNDIKKVSIEFNDSKFKIYQNSAHTQEHLKIALENFFKEKSIEKIIPRMEKWSKETNLIYKEIKFRKLKKRWGSCTYDNKIILSINAIQLPFSLIDYLIVHELSHIKVKNHSKDFWIEVSKHLSNWEELDRKIKHIKI